MTHLDKTDLQILEIGAGPLSLIGKKWEGKNIYITPTDYLANEYNEILRKAKITPIVSTIFADAENLLKQFKKKPFDYVSCNNCLDHMDNPLKAIQEMLSVVDNGCYISIQHRKNEGEQENYEGLHQWNITEEKGNMLIWSPIKHTINVQKLLGSSAILTCQTVKGFIHASIQKSNIH